MVKVPGEGASEEDIAAYRQAVGAPDSVDGYGLAEPPEGLTAEQWNTDFGNKVAEALHKHNAPPSLAKELASIQMEMSKADNETYQQEFEQAKAVHSESLKNNDGAAEAIQAWGLNPEDLPTGTHPFFSKLYGLMKEDPGVRKALGIGDLDLETGNPHTRAKDIITNKTNPLYAAYHGQKGEAEQSRVQKMVHHLFQQT
jgi:hypothetical protein